MGVDPLSFVGGSRYMFIWGDSTGAMRFQAQRAGQQDMWGQFEILITQASAPTLTFGSGSPAGEVVEVGLPGGE